MRVALAEGGEVMNMRRLGQDIKLGARFIGRGLVYSGCALVTVFILASGYEIAFGQSLPFIKAINTVDLEFITPSVTPHTKTLSRQTDIAKEGNYGTPYEMKIGTNPVRIPLAQPQYRHGNWLARASTSHYILLNDAKIGNIGDMLVYMTAGKTTVADPATIPREGNLYVYTKRDWRYLYKITEVVSLSSTQKYVLPAAKDSSRIYVVIQQPSGPTIITGTLTNVQNANQL
ncbi:MAG TPA: hypothetical protein VJ836_04140 [Candidatus Saccharimonadales bacterium]|nr:hypothetical protein [Candidatus Saccharimonadales bacterium]